MPHPNRRPTPPPPFDWRPGMPEPEPTMCDFCSRSGDRGSLTRFPCATFQRKAVARLRTGDVLIETCSCHTPIRVEPGDMVAEQGCHGDWAACPDCAEAIVAGERDRLARLAVASLAEREPLLMQSLPTITVYDHERGDAQHIMAPGWVPFFLHQHEAFFRHRLASASSPGTRR